MALTDRQKNEIYYYKRRISLLQEKLQNLVTDPEVLMAKFGNRYTFREYIMEAEKIGKLRSEIADFESKIAGIKNIAISR